MSLKITGDRKLLTVFVLAGFCLLSACSFHVKKTAPDADQVMVYIPPAIKPTERRVTETPEGGSQTTKIVCEDKLTFVEDVNYPDGSVVAPQSIIEKQWKIKNSGVCDWNNKYKVLFKEGDALGAAEEQPLYPVRSDSEYVLKINFKAPAQPGYYRGVWQASNSDGMLFGDPFYLDIIVAR